MKASQHRLGVYDIVKGVIGRDLTPLEHSHLKDKMQAYVAEHGEETAKSALGAREYIYTCKKCQSVSSAKGKMERKMIGGAGIQPKRK